MELHPIPAARAQQSPPTCRTPPRTFLWPEDTSQVSALRRHKSSLTPAAAAAAGLSRVSRPPGGVLDLPAFAAGVAAAVSVAAAAQSDAEVLREVGATLGADDAHGPECSPALKDAVMCLPDAFVDAVRCLVAVGLPMESSHDEVSDPVQLQRRERQRLVIEPCDDSVADDELKTLWFMLRDCLFVLRCLYSDQAAACALAATYHRDLLPMLFRIMDEAPPLFHAAVCVAEVIAPAVPHTECPIDLARDVTVARLNRIVNALSPLNLSTFCRGVLAHSVYFEPEPIAPGVPVDPIRILTPAELLKARMASHSTARSPSVIDRNIAVLLRTPTLVSKLISLVAFPMPAHNSRSLPSEIAAQLPPGLAGHAMFSVPEQVPEEKNDNDVDLPGNDGANAERAADDWNLLRRLLQNRFDGPPSASQPPATAATVPSLITHDMVSPSEFVINLNGRPVKISMKLLDLSSNLVDVLFVLTGMCSGRRKADAQALYVKHDIFTAIDKVLSRLRWDEDQEPSRVHGVRCECNHDAHLKMHCLRLIGCLGDSEDEDVNRLAYSETEQNLVFSSVDKTDAIFAFTEKSDSESVQTSPCSAGLASKLADIIINYPKSKDLFCVCTALEAVIRRGPENGKLLLARRGLLQALLKMIADHHDSIEVGSRDEASLLQAGFDVCAELIKGSRPTFERMLNTDAAITALLPCVLEKAAARLDDSNVFLRSIFLSLAQFDALDNKTADRSQRYPSDCMLRYFMTNNMVQLLHDGLYAVSKFTHDTISTLNTVALFLFAGPRNTSALLIDMEVMYVERDDWNLLGRQPVADRVLDLMRFWRQFYSLRAVEAVSLEQSSSIAFDDWLAGISSIEAAASDMMLTV
jgi:Protein of unknown function (DUF3689)